ncbi:hypothetical protein D3C76_1390450 [compost metagenome]
MRWELPGYALLLIRFVIVISFAAVFVHLINSEFLQVGYQHIIGHFAWGNAATIGHFHPGSRGRCCCIDRVFRTHPHLNCFAYDVIQMTMLHQ